jgi:exodeoxyribonuclease-1
LFRYRARNWPETLSAAEHATWEAYRRERLTKPEAGASITLADYQAQLSRLVVEPTLTAEQRALLNLLLDWPAQLGLTASTLLA